MLNDKIALVTGGSSGIGKAVSLRLAAEGARVHVVASGDRQKAQRVVDEIVDLGGSAEGHVVDVRQPAQVADLVSAIEGGRGAVDILVTAAGIFQPSAVGEADLEAFDRLIDTNLKSAFYCINAVVPGMARRGQGKIVCFSSVAATLGVKGFAGYCASKAGISMLVRALALELAPLNININAVAPGNTATPMNASIREDPANIAFLEEMKRATPSKRIFSEPEDIAGMVLFLATDQARAMHGSTVLMDEGLSAGI